MNDWVGLVSAVTLNQDSDRTRLVCWTGRAGRPEDWLCFVGWKRREAGCPSSGGQEMWGHMVEFQWCSLALASPGHLGLSVWKQWPQAEAEGAIFLRGSVWRYEAWGSGPCSFCAQISWKRPLPSEAQTAVCLQNTKDSEKGSTGGDWQLRVSGGSSFGQDVSRVSVDFHDSGSGYQQASCWQTTEGQLNDVPSMYFSSKCYHPASLGDTQSPSKRSSSCLAESNNPIHISEKRTG